MEWSGLSPSMTSVRLLLPGGSVVVVVVVVVAKSLLSVARLCAPPELQVTSNTLRSAENERRCELQS